MKWEGVAVEMFMGEEGWGRAKIPQKRRCQKHPEGLYIYTPQNMLKMECSPLKQEDMVFYPPQLPTPHVNTIQLPLKRHENRQP